MEKQIECPWCKNTFKGATSFNNHFYVEDYEEEHLKHESFKPKNAKILIDKYYTAVEKMERKKKTIKFIKQNEDHLKQWDIDNMLKSIS